MHAGGDHQSVARNFVAVRQLDNPVRAFGPDAHGFLGRKNFDSKSPGLHHGAPRQVAATQSVGKSEIVLNARAHSRLAARSLTLDHHRVQAFGRSIDCSRQARRPSAHDRQIVKAGLRSSSQSDFLSDIGRNTLQKLCPIGKQHHRKTRRLRPQCFQKSLRFRIVGGSLNIDPLIRDVVSRQKIAQFIRTAATSACLAPGFPRRSDGRKPANRRADRPTADRDVPLEDPTAS